MEYIIFLLALVLIIKASDIESLSDSERRKIIIELTNEMQQMALELNFEKAAFLRDKIKELNDTKKH